MKTLKQILNENDEWAGHKCYEYAVGCKREKSSILPSVPGATANAPMKNYSMDELRRGLEADGAIHAGSGRNTGAIHAGSGRNTGAIHAGSGSNIPPPKKGYRIIYAATSYGHPNGNDFHFYRQDPNGTWSHRLHNINSNKDASGKTIINPHEADRDYSKTLFNGLKSGTHYHNGAFFYVPEDGLATAKAVSPPKFNK